jgi:chromosome partitioning protein
MAVVIALFNHKGGVSKTTTAFNPGWALADRGKRVLIVDGDPQCNLTGTVLGFGGVADFTEFYADRPHANISDCLAPVFRGAGAPLEPADMTETQHPNLFLLAGNITLAANETQVSVALSTRESIPALQNIPGSLCALLRMTAEAHNIEVVIIDMSPSVGALNQCLLIGSDFFIVPTSPDYYCKQAVWSLAGILPAWNTTVAPFRSSALAYPFPPQPPKFCGIISQRYRPRLSNPAKSFQAWIDEIKDTVLTELVPSLRSRNMCISEAEFNAADPADTPYNLANIADFNSLIAQSQQYNTPIFALTDAQIEQVGKVLQTMKANREDFRKTFEGLARSIEIITGITPRQRHARV